jgi:anti-sigma regulatory factor (Ser/Thr protein kinase)
MARHLFQYELPVPANWDGVDHLRASVLSGLRAAFPGHSGLEPLAMVAGELVENAVKFGKWGDPARAVLGLTVTGEPGRVELVVSSPTDLDDPNLKALVAELGRIQHAPSPQEAYLEKVRRVAIAGKGGLGLSRIAHEGGCDLSADVTPDRTLRVKAVTRRLGPRTATPAAP